MAQGVTLRVTPSYLWADKTGLVTEPEEAFNLRLALGYAASDGMQFNGYYNYKSEENGNNSFTDKVVAPTVPLSYTQNLDNVFHSAGASVSLTPAERLNATVSFDWNQNDFETYYFSTNRRRFESAANGVIFALRGDSNYKIDTWSLSLNGDYEASDALKLSAGYTYSVSDGSGVTIDTIQDPDYVVREEIDNSLHSLMLGATYGLNKSMTLRGGYIYDKYDDNFYDSLSGGAHTVILGLSIKM
jgi:long-subunit fatty acid transport protein